MDLGIAGKVAVVTAASKGLGYAVAQRLCEEGARVAICARNAEALEQAHAQLQQCGGQPVFAQTCDVSDRQQIQSFFAALKQELGEADILVCNAGGPPPGTFESVNEGQWQDAFDLNLMSAVHLIHQALPAMKKRQWGRILLMVSISAKQPLANLLLSNAIRAGVIGMAKTLADEVASYGVLVNSLCPGFIETGRMKQVIESQAQANGVDYERQLAKVSQSIPLGRLGQPEEFADFAAYLVSERASFVTGGTFLADGGMFRGLM